MYAAPSSPYNRNSTRAKQMTNRYLQIAVALLIVSASALWFVRRAESSSINLESRSGYYAFFLDNNLVIYGKPEGLGKAYFVVNDAFYVRTTVNPETKEAASRIVRRGSEWHGPDKMMINAQRLILAEPVGPESRVAELIRAVQQQKATPPASE
jgi:hypothetical protein